MKTLTIPTFLHEVFGKEQKSNDLIIIIISGLLFPIFLFTLFKNEYSQLPLWRIILAFIIVADIASGAVGNLTKSTNNHYKEKPKARYIFYSIHIHLIALFLLMGAPILSSLYISLYIIGSALVINSLYSNKSQSIIAISFVLIAFIGITVLMESGNILILTSFVFAVKLIFSFSVDHYRSQ